jgi:hypothetical protein
MTKHVRVRATCLLKSVGEDEEPRVVESALWQVTLLVGNLSKTNYYGVVPGQDSGREGERAEGVAKDVMDQSAVRSLVFNYVDYPRLNPDSVHPLLVGLSIKAGDREQTEFPITGLPAEEL